MKFPRNTKLLRSPFEMAPFAAVFFLLVIFLMLGALLPTPGLPLTLQPPTTDDLPGAVNPRVAVAIDSGGRFYFANQIVSAVQLKIDLRDAASTFKSPPMLVIHADKSVSFEQLVNLTMLARGVGIQNVLLATLPPVEK